MISHCATSQFNPFKYLLRYCSLQGAMSERALPVLPWLPLQQAIHTQSESPQATDWSSVTVCPVKTVRACADSALHACAVTATQTWVCAILSCSLLKPAPRSASQPVSEFQPMLSAHYYEPYSTVEKISDVCGKSEWVRESLERVKNAEKVSVARSAGPNIAVLLKVRTALCCTNPGM